MKITHLCRVGWPQVGGMERAVEGLARAMAERGHRVTIVSLGRPGVDRSGPVKRVRLRRVGPAIYPFALGLSSTLSDADVVHVHGVDGLADQVARMGLNVPIGLSTHGGYFHHDRYRLIKRLVFQSVTRRTLAHFDAIWFTSKQDQRRFQPICSSGEVMPNGLSLRSRLTLKRQPVPGRWLVFGRMDDHKGLFEMLQLFKGLVEVFPGAHLRLVGEEGRPGIITELKERALGAGVSIIGPVSERQLSDELRLAEIAFFPSQYEGFGLSLVECLAAGLPTIARRIPAFCEILSRQPTALVDLSLGQTVDAIRHARGSHNPERARDLARPFDWDTMTKRWERAYNSLRKNQ